MNPNVALFILVLFSGLMGFSLGTHKVQEEWDAAIAVQIQEQAKQEEKARGREKELEAKLAQLKKEKADEQVRIAALQRSISSSLQQRAKRPSDGDLPKTSSVGNNSNVCTGRELFREDGEFLAREAYRADSFRLQLIACQAAYQEAMK